MQMMTSESVIDVHRPVASLYLPMPTTHDASSDSAHCAYGRIDESIALALLFPSSLQPKVHVQAHSGGRHAEGHLRNKGEPGSSTTWLLFPGKRIVVAHDSLGDTPPPPPPFFVLQDCEGRSAEEQDIRGGDSAPQALLA